MKVEEMKELIREGNESAVFYSDIDGALIASGQRFSDGPLAVYDYDKCIEIFMSQGMNESEAQEHVEYNVLGGWVGNGTPIFIHDFRND